jgi:sugar lactone lactonase YvrE
MSSWLWCIAALGLASCSGPPPSPPRVYAPGELHEEYAFSQADLFPEGAAYDAVSRSFFVGSLAHGGVTRLSIDGEESVFVAGRDGQLTLGMSVDAEARRLWVCAITDAETQAGVVWVLDIASGERLLEIDLGALRTGASCNDIALDSDGAAYVTDRQNPAIYRLTLLEQSIWTDHPLLAPGTVGLNGAAVTPDGSALIVSHYLPAQLLRVSMAKPRDVSKVALRGHRFTGGIHIAAGADGLRFLDGQLFVAFDRWVMRVTADDASWRSATVHAARPPVPYGVTALVEADGALYATNGQTAMFLLGLPPSKPFRLVRIAPELFE